MVRYVQSGLLSKMLDSFRILILTSLYRIHPYSLPNISRYMAGPYCRISTPPPIFQSLTISSHLVVSSANWEFWAVRRAARKVRICSGVALRVGTGILGVFDFLPFLVNLVKKVGFSEWFASSSVRLVALLLVEVEVMVGRSLVVLPEVLLMLARLREEVKGLERASWVVRRNMFGEGMEGESECVYVCI